MNRINILYQFDNKYAPYAGISIVSLVENNKDADIYIYCAAMDVCDDNKRLIEETVKKYGLKHLRWLDIEKAMHYIKELNVGDWNGSKATWIKMFIIPELPEDVDKILYLDCDTLVEGDICRIQDIDICNSYVAAAYDSIAQHFAMQIGTKAYYNAGVMYINVNKWKEDGFFESMINHLERNIASYPDNDQRLLNDFFRDKIVLLPECYNIQGIHIAYNHKAYCKIYKNSTYYSAEELEVAQKKPVIYHFFRFLGDYPWEEGNYHPMKERFFYWKSRSLWSSYPLIKKKRSLVFKIERLLYKVLPKSIFLILFKTITKSGK